MNKLVITGINFKYDDGHDQPYSSVEIQFISQGTAFNLHGKVTVNRNYYNTHQEISELKLLVLKKVVAEFGQTLAE